MRDPHRRDAGCERRTRSAGAGARVARGDREAGRRLHRHDRCRSKPTSRACSPARRHARSKPPALEALAITIRTFALANAGRHRADGFDLCDQTHCQVLRAANASHRARGRRRPRAGSCCATAVRRRSIYSASCGGHTEIPSRVWPGAEDPPLPPSQEDDACQGAPAWTTEIDERDLLRALRARGFTGDRLRDVRIASRNRSSRVARLKLEGLRPDEISGQDLRVVVGRTLGWQRIQSTAFELDKRGDAVSLRRPRGGARRRHVLSSGRRGWRSAEVSPREHSCAIFPGTADIGRQLTATAGPRPVATTV